MKSFKDFSTNTITEGTVSIWSGALRRKPKAYADGFISMWKNGEKMKLTNDKGYVELKKDPDLIKTLEKAAKDGLTDDEMIDALKNGINGRGKWQFDGRTAYLKDVDGNDINLNKVDKENVNPQKTPSGAEWESIISVGFNMLDIGQKSPIPSDFKKYGLDKITIFDKFWPKYNDISLKLGKAFKEEGFKPPMIQTGAGGSGTIKLNKDWTTWGGKNKTPKTDMSTKERKISLKKKGGSQLMSAQKGEAMATFHAALQLMGTNSKNQKYIEGIIKKINSDFKTIMLEGTVGDLDNPNSALRKGLEKSGDFKKKKQEIVDQQAVNESLSTLMEEVFNGKGRSKEVQEFHKSFKEHFVFEAASGLTKFKGGLGTASHLVEFTESGTISKFHPMGKVDGIGDGQWNIHQDIKDMARSVDFYVSFKTGSKNPYSALRTKTAKQVKEDYEPTLRDLVLETLEEDGILLLTEENIQLDEWSLVKKAFDKVSRRASKMRGWVQDKAKDAMNWLKGFIGALLKKVSQALSKIVAMGKKALHALLKFFGFEPKNASGSGPAIIFHKMV